MIAVGSAIPMLVPVRLWDILQQLPGSGWQRIRILKPVVDSCFSKESDTGLRARNGQRERWSPRSGSGGLERIRMRFQIRIRHDSGIDRDAKDSAGHRFSARWRGPAGSQIIVSGAFHHSPRNLVNPDPTAAVRWGDQS